MLFGWCTDANCVWLAACCYSCENSTKSLCHCYRERGRLARFARDRQYWMTSIEFCVHGTWFFRCNAYLTDSLGIINSIALGIALACMHAHFKCLLYWNVIFFLSRFCCHFSMCQFLAVTVFLLSTYTHTHIRYDFVANFRAHSSTHIVRFCYGRSDYDLRPACFACSMLKSHKVIKNTVFRHYTIYIHNM